MRISAADRIRFAVAGVKAQARGRAIEQERRCASALVRGRIGARAHWCAGALVRWREGGCADKRGARASACESARGRTYDKWRATRTRARGRARARAPGRARASAHARVSRCAQCARQREGARACLGMRVVVKMLRVGWRRCALGCGGEGCQRPVGVDAGAGGGGGRLRAGDTTCIWLGKVPFP